MLLYISLKTFLCAALYALNLTARQYGAFVLADASAGQCPFTPSTRGQKVVTAQGGHGAVFGVMAQIT
jgi:hypothetical protein